MAKSVPMPFNKRDSAGFTLIEVISVLILLVILTAVAVTRLGSNQSNLRAELNDLKAGLRYAQQMALASDDTVTFSISVAATSYTLVRTGGTGSQPLLPGENSSTHTFSGVAATTATFNFNSWGGLSAGSSSATTLTQSGGTSKTINVISETGYAYES